MAGEEDEFDKMFKEYEKKLTKKLKEPTPKGPAFEEVVMSD